MTELVGRDEPIAVLRRYLAEAGGGRGRLVLIGGEPGIGKTTLAATVADQATADGTRVVWGVCVEGEGVPDFWPVPDILAQLDPGHHVPPDNAADAWFSAATSVVNAVRAAAPVVVMLDDLQWASAATIRVLDFAVRALRRDPVLVLGAYRDVEVDAEHPLAGLLGVADVVPLQGLPPAEVDRLLRPVLGERAAAVAAPVHGRTGGNPFFALQIGRLLASGSGEQAVPAAVDEAIRRRFARLPQGTVEALRVAAVMGNEVDAAIVATAIGADTASIVDRLGPAIAARVLRQTEVGVYRFEHDLFRQTATAELGPDSLARTHLAIALALAERREAGGAVRAGEIAHHWARAVPPADPVEALGFVLDAARDATSRHAHEEAVRHWRHAMRLAELAQAVPPAMKVEYGLALLRAGDIETAREILLDAASRSDDDPIALGNAAFALHLTGTQSGSSHGEVIALLTRALSTLDRRNIRDPITVKVRAALARELADGPDRDLERAESLAAQAVDEAQQGTDAAALAFCLSAQHDVIWGPGTAARRLDLATKMAAAASSAGDGELAFQAALGRYVALLELADPHTASALADLEDLAQRLKQPRLTYLALSRRAGFTILTGDPEAARRQIESAHELGQMLGEPDAYGVYVTQLIAWAIAGGGPAAAGKALEHRSGPALPPEYAPHEAAFRHLAHDDTAAALAVLSAPRPVPPLSLFRWRALSGAALEIEVDVAAGATALLPASYDYLREFAGTTVLIGGAVCALGPVDFYLGLAAQAMGDQGAAADHVRRATELAGRLGARLRLVRSDRPPAEFRNTGEVWTLTFAGTSAQLADAKGLRDIATLLAMPGKTVTALQLYGSAEPDTGSDEVLDATARAAYKQRLADLEEEIEEAEAANDQARAAKRRAEREALVDALAAAYGLGGRARRLGDLGERARTAVTARIRDSLRRIERVHPALGRHLRESISTGRSCVYEPAEEVRWVL